MTDIQQLFFVFGVLAAIVFIGIFLGAIAWIIVENSTAKKAKAKKQASRCVRYPPSDDVSISYDSIGNIKRLGDELRAETRKKVQHVHGGSANGE